MLWDVFCEDLQENGQRYNGIALWYGRHMGAMASQITDACYDTKLLSEPIRLIISETCDIHLRTI